MSQNNADSWVSGAYVNYFSPEEALVSIYMPPPHTHTIDYTVSSLLSLASTNEVLFMVVCSKHVMSTLGLDMILTEKINVSLQDC